VLLVPVGLFALLSLDLSGVVTDQSGRPVPRAVVQVTASDGHTVESVFTDADGVFHVVNAPDGCRVQASLTGFIAATAVCSSQPMTLALSVAPVAEHVVVSATRTEAPAGQVGAAITVFDAAEIDRHQDPLLADLLRDAPGAMVVREGAPGAVTSLFVRGGESNYTKVLLDGIPLNEPGGAFDLSNVTTGNLERVEFVRGADSALYGSDAMTGVIQLFTRRGRTSRPDVNVWFEGGTFSTARGSGSVAGRDGRLDYSAAVAGVSTDNEVPNNHFGNVTVSGSAGVRFAHDASLRFVVRSEDGRTGTPGQTSFGRPDLDAFYTRRATDWGVTFDQTTGAVRQHASYGLAIEHQRSADLVVDPPYTPSFDGSTAPFEFSDFLYDSRTDLRRHHASYQADATWSAGRGGTHVDTALVDWDGERATLTDALANSVVPASRDNVGFSLQHQAMWSRVFVTGGLRVEHNASFGTATVPRGSAAWYVHTGNGGVGTTRLHASAGLGIKEPTILESFSTNPFFLGNPTLQPERTRAFDGGVEQRLAADRVSVDATWFNNRYKNIISLQTTDPDTFAAQYFNIGLTRASGAELTGNVVLVHGLRAKGGYTFVDSMILESTSSSPVFQPGNWAFRRPRHSGFVDLAWSGARASIDLAGTIIGRRVDSDFSSLEPPLTFNNGYAQWDLRVSARLMRQLSLTGAIDNLTDRQYMEPLGYPALGRAVRIGIKFHY
jgi:outer membrane cobalamin receptor